jgi:shikimate kinase
MRIYLVGYMGTGKSYLGKMLSERLGFPYFDTDAIIEAQKKKMISQIFSEEGEEAFRLYEKEAIRSFDMENAVVSCGGGLPCFHDNMENMLEDGIVIWIKSSVQDIIERIGKDKERPLLNMEDKELTSFIKKHLKSRKKYYSKSQVKVWNRGPTIGTVNRMITYLRYLDSTRN